MATTNGTRRASGARGGARRRRVAGIHPGQLSMFAALPHLNEDAATAVHRFAEKAFPSRAATRHAGRTSACTATRPSTPLDAQAPGDAGVWCAPTTPYEHYTPVFMLHDVSGPRVVSPQETVRQMLHLIEHSFHRKGPLIDQPHVVRALLHLQLAAHPQVVFAALFIDRWLRLIDYVELSKGTMAEFPIYPREVVRQALDRNAEAAIFARNDPTGDGTPTAHDGLAAQRLRQILARVDVRVLDYLVVGRRILSLAERGAL